MPIRTFAPIRKQLTARSTTEEFEPYTPFYLSMEAISAISLVLMIGYKTGNFQCRIGIQTCDKLIEQANAPLNPASYSSLTVDIADQAEYWEQASLFVHVNTGSCSPGDPNCNETLKASPATRTSRPWVVRNRTEQR